MTHDTLTAAHNLTDRLVAWRRHLHAHPELSGQEVQTATFVAQTLRELGLTPIERVGDSCGVMATLDAGRGPVVALRADMDALPVNEETGVPYASQVPGVMHACGHDAHMAMLLGAAQLLVQRRAQLRQPVRFIFQPSEERAPGGALAMIAGGALENVGAIFGLHVWSEMPLGTLGTRVGPFMASPDDLAIEVLGQGGHAAMPHQCTDPVVVAAQIIVALQTIVSRSISMADAAVVSITQLDAGSAANVIPERVRLKGTVRTLSETTRALVHRRVRELAAGVASAFGARADVHIAAGYPALINHRDMVAHALDCARRLGLRDDQILTLPPQGGGEDFASYAQRVPAAFLFLGARNDAKHCNHPHHHSRFNIDEDALPIGAALHVELALAGLPTAG